MKFKYAIAIILILSIAATSDAQDWANLKRYQVENKTLKAQKDKQDRIVLMGNSITEGWSHSSPEFLKNNGLINRGISGQTSPQMLLRFRQDVIALNPMAVVILAGTNDIAGNTGPSSIEMIADNIFSMVELARAHDIKVIIASVLPAYDYPWKPGLNPDKKIPDLNNILKTYATEHGVAYLDYFSSMSDDKMGLIKAYGDDGVHPNKTGYAVMEKMLVEAIEKIKSN